MGMVVVVAYLGSKTGPWVNWRFRSHAVKAYCQEECSKWRCINGEDDESDEMIDEKFRIANRKLREIRRGEVGAV